MISIVSTLFSQRVLQVARPPLGIRISESDPTGPSHRGSFSCNSAEEAVAAGVKSAARSRKEQSRAGSRDRGLEKIVENRGSSCSCCWIASRLQSKSVTRFGTSTSQVILTTASDRKQGWPLVHLRSLNLQPKGPAVAWETRFVPDIASTEEEHVVGCLAAGSYF